MAKLESTDIKLIIELLKDLPLPDVAKKFEISRFTIERELAKNNVHVPWGRSIKLIKNKRATLEKVKSHLNQGINIYEACKINNISIGQYQTLNSTKFN